MEKRLNEHVRSAEIARANALEREAALMKMADEAATAVNTAIVAEHQQAVDTMRKLEHSLAHVQEELERERRAREELSSREKKLNEAIAASTTEIALLQSKLGEMEKSRDAMRHAMSQTKEKTLQSVAFRLKNRATSQAWSSWVAMWRDVTAARARLLGIFSRWRHRGMSQGWVTWHAWWQACTTERNRLRRTMAQWRGQSLALGWRSWVWMAAERSEALRKLRQGAMKLLFRRTAHGFAKWVCTAAERSEALRKLRQGAMKLLFRRMAHGFAKWQSVYRSGSRSLIRRALGRLAHRGLSRAWQTWRAGARRAQAKSAIAVKSKLHRATRRIQALEKQVEIVSSEMDRLRILHTHEVSEMAERLAKAERIAERERLHRADMEQELIKTGWGSRVLKSPVRSPRTLVLK